MSKVEEKMQELEVELPQPNTPKFSYVATKQFGDYVYTSGQDCRVNGKLMFEGKLGKDVSVEEGQEAAKQGVINCLSVIKEEIGDLDKIKQVVKILGFVNSTDGFVEQPYVLDGASKFLVEILGEKGKHARSAVACNELPFNTPVEIEMIVEVIN
ncbi:RidA family protein [Salibacterium aidingense]|uniref:RidA family protein n=1 Tax=Salibacterium aidingense TaxID=384933 RepID=UPI0003FB6960|nr:RidA family protein [Salibacterium aidingense]